MKIEIDTHNELLVLDGVKLSFATLDFIVNPSSKYWYKFQRLGDHVVATRRQDCE